VRRSRRPYALTWERLLADPVVRAAAEELHRARCRNGYSPLGSYRSPGGEWYPAQAEVVFDSFRGVERPTRRRPETLRRHAVSLGHCRRLVTAWAAAVTASRLALPRPGGYLPSGVGMALGPCGNVLLPPPRALGAVVLPARLRGRPLLVTLASHWVAALAWAARKDDPAGCRVEAVLRDVLAAELAKEGY
jgi:hypothetical protein